MVIDAHKAVEDAWIAMHGRILRCPLGGNPEHCPLHAIRKKPVEERLEWLHSKSGAELQELFELHRNCREHKSSVSR